MTPTEQARAVVEALEKVERSGYDGQRRRCPACLIPSTWRAHSEGCELYAALLAARALLLGLEREHAVWLVLLSGYDTCHHYGWFSDKSRAEEYAEEMRQALGAADIDSVEVLRCPIDLPRRELHGAWCVQLSASGALVSESFEDFNGPDYDGWESGVVGAHWWDNGSGVRALGLTKDEAHARARKMLALPAPPESPEEEPGCAHAFEANYGLYDTMHRYCTKCGVAEQHAPPASD